MSNNPFEQDLDRNAANYVPLSPLGFLRRSALVYPDKVAIVHGDGRTTYAQMHERCRRLASALGRRGIGRGDTVSVMAPNVPAMLEAHFGVPLAGAVLNALNYRLDPGAVRFILEHARTKVLLTDREFSGVIGDALDGMADPPLVIDIDDPLADGGELIGETDYEAFLAAGDPDDDFPPLDDEWQAIALNYTSGTTGNPKGVVFHHRGAYLNALGQLLAFGVDQRATYLWTLPMFHCNGWTYTWGVTAAAATHVCLRRVDPAFVFPLIGFCIAPIYPAINSVILSALPTHQHGSMAGLIVVFSALGGTSGSIITGFLFEAVGGQNAFYFSLLPIGLLLFTLYLFKRSTNKLSAPGDVELAQQSMH